MESRAELERREVMDRERESRAGETRGDGSRERARTEEMVS